MKWFQYFFIKIFNRKERETIFKIEVKGKYLFLKKSTYY